MRSKQPKLKSQNPTPSPTQWFNLLFFPILLLTLIGLIPLFFFGGTSFTVVCLVAGGSAFLWLKLKPSPSTMPPVQLLALTLLYLGGLIVAFFSPKELSYAFRYSSIAWAHWLICALIFCSFWIMDNKRAFYPILFLAFGGVSVLFLIRVQAFLQPGLILLFAISAFTLWVLQVRANRVHSSPKPLILAILLLFFVYLVILQSAWLCDDAFITFRTIDNALHGYGLRWNIAERVQTYTHPLYMLLLTTLVFFTHDFYYTSILFNILITLLALILLIRFIAPSVPSALLALITLSFSKAFMDYSTSGLENSMTFLALAGFTALYYAPIPAFKKNIALAIVAALGAFNRLDTVLFFLPTLGWQLWQTQPQLRLKTALYMSLGFVPLVIWEIFATLYYGFPFPNTAYAKLFLPHFSGGSILSQGISYFLNSFALDPLTLIIIALTTITLLSSNVILNAPLILGAVFYLLYVIKIGGDFMSGRFLAAPFFLSVLIFFRSFDVKPKNGAILLFSLLMLSGITPFNPWRTDTHYNGVISHRFITDERQFYYQSTGLLRTRPGQTLTGSPEHQTTRRKNAALYSKSTQRTTVHIAMGILGFYAGPHVYIIDEVALCDPLLARIPSWCQEFCPGHMIRKIPNGYLRSINTNSNQLSNPHLHQLYDKLRLVTRGPVFSLPRFKEIIKFNLGSYDFSSRLTFYLTPRPHKPLPFDLSDDAYSKRIRQARIFIDDSDYLKLEDCLHEAIILDPKRPEARIYLGILYEYLGELDKASDCFNYFASEPKSPWKSFSLESQRDFSREMAP